MKAFQYIKWFDEIRMEDLPLVGGKNASLGEMYGALRPKGIRIPNGFAITTEAYNDFIAHNNLKAVIENHLSQVSPDKEYSLQEQGKAIRGLILEAAFPKALEEEILKAYESLSGASSIDVAVRSSATAEDLPDASFAGQQETYLNVQGNAPLLESCKKCFASLYTNRAISYRAHRSFDESKLALSIGVQQMVRSDLASSGVMFSIDTETGFQNAVLINAAYGLGENVVQGSINPDEYYVFKPTLKTGFKPILQKSLGSKEFKMVYDVGGTKKVKNLPVLPEDQVRFALEDEEILQLAKWAVEIEEHYSNKRGELTPMDMEWAKDGKTGELFIVQARPETVQSQKNINVVETYALEETGKSLLEGRAVGSKIAHGTVRVIQDPKDLNDLREGEVLVAEKTDPDWEPAMKKASAIITDRGGRTCHAAIVSRELGLPAVIGSNVATSTLATGQNVTVDCAQGEVGVVYDGLLNFKREELELSSIPETKTKLMMNLAKPDEAFRLSFYPNDGVGLARLEFIINNIIKIHPLALLHFDKIEKTSVRDKVEELTKGYKDKSQYFVDKLAEGMAMIGAAFYPKPVIVRMSDFKSDEYANLIGGFAFEPEEDNPMIGFRGASRYYSDEYRDAFALECQALKKAREEMGLTNIKAMIPFCRTVEEARRVQEEMAKNGLKRGEKGLEIYMMCEIPSNVILADQFAEHFDGFSIGSNDLTQLTLGVDRNSSQLSHLFQEENEAVKRSIASFIKVVKGKGRKVGICGQGPSDSPEFAKFLIQCGIDSLSLMPDSLLQTRFTVRDAEGEGL